MKFLYFFFLFSFWQSTVWALDYHGSAQLNSELFPRSVGSGLRNAFGSIELNAAFEQNLGEYSKIVVKPLFVYSPYADSKSEQIWKDLPEGYVQIKPPLFESATLGLQAGMNIFSWGVTDGFNPLDIVNARRLSDPLNAQKLGAPEVSMQLDFSAVSFQAIYIPVQRRSILPGENSRWLPREAFRNQTFSTPSSSALLIPPESPHYTITHGIELNRALKNNYGVKVDAHAPSLDLALMAFSGAAQLPSTDLKFTGKPIELDPQVIIAVDPGVQVTPVYYRNLVFGGSAVYATNSLIIRGEAAVTTMQSSYPSLPGWSQEFVLELEHEFNLPQGKLVGILEGTFARHPPSDEITVASLPRIFDRALILSARYSPTEHRTITGSLLLDHVTDGQFLRLEYEEGLNDAWKILGTIDVLNGPDQTPLSIYSKNSRAQLGIKYSL